MLKVNDEVREFYEENQEELENDFENYVLENEWGSGEDKIRITDTVFWEFVEEKYNERVENEAS
jgi:hypothetical protein